MSSLYFINIYTFIFQIVVLLTVLQLEICQVYINSVE